MVVVVGALFFLPFMIVGALWSEDSMFRHPAQQLRDAAAGPVRVRVALDIVVGYLPVALVAALLYWLVRATGPVLPLADHAPSGGPAPGPGAAPWRRQAVAAGVLCAAVTACFLLFRATPEERDVAQRARDELAEELLPPIGAVASPSGTILASAAVSEYADRSELHLTSWPRNAATEPGLDPRRLLAHVGTFAHGVVLSWDDDTHLTVAGSLRNRDGRGNLLSGPERLGTVHVTYRPSVFQHLAAPETPAVQLTGVRYAVEEARARWMPEHGAVCALRVTGLDAAGHRRVGLSLVGIGVGNPSSTDYFIPYVLLFEGTDLPGVDERLTLTQGTVPDMPPLPPPYADAQLGAPFQASLRDEANPGQAGPGSLLRQVVGFSSPLSREQVSAVFDRFRNGRFSIVLQFGLGRRTVAYGFDAPIPHPVAATFQACEAKTNISRPLLGPRLVRDPSTDRP